MAESQHPFPYTPADRVALKAALSNARFATYLRLAGNDETYALALYLYNARLAKAFLFPLNIVEVTLRNAIDESLVATYGNDWFYNDRFRSNVLTEEGLWTLDKAIDRVGGYHASRDQIVSTLTFDFWSNLFRPEYGSFWRTKLNVVLPNLPRGETRHDIQVAVKEINQFRNRIAHHEPILDLNAIDIMSKIKMLVRFRCPATEAWMRYHTTVARELRSRPDAQGASGVTLASRQDAQFIRVVGNETLVEIMSQVSNTNQVIVRLAEDGTPTGACTTEHIAASIASAAVDLDMNGLVSLRDIQIDSVLGNTGPAPHWAILADDRPMANAVDILRQPQIKVLVGVSSNSGQATGVLVRAHRRY